MSEALQDTATTESTVTDDGAAEVDSSVDTEVGAEVDAEADSSVDAVVDSADAADSADEAEEAEEAEEPKSERAGDDLLVREGDIAGDYLERLLDLLDYDGDIDLDVEAGRAVISIDGGDDLEKLVGPRGSVLEALQELTRLSVQQETGVRSRLMLDIAGWRAARRDELKELGKSAAEEAVRTGQQVKLHAMTPFERKVVHDAVAAVQGAHSESEGEEPRRRVVVFTQS